MDFFSGNQPWSACSSENFWSRLSTACHVANITGDDYSDSRLVQNFLLHCLSSQQSLILIASESRIAKLESFLDNSGYNAFNLKLKDSIIFCEVEKILSMFMIDGWPDDVLFRYVISTLSARARRSSSGKVRVLSEVTSTLWSTGFKAAAIQVEHLWSKLCEAEQIQVVCRYAETDLERGYHSSLAICEHHSEVFKSKKFYPTDLMIVDKEAMNSKGHSIDQTSE
jgi:hypothetical protein